MCVTVNGPGIQHITYENRKKKDENLKSPGEYLNFQPVDDIYKRGASSSSSSSLFDQRLPPAGTQGMHGSSP